VGFELPTPVFERAKTVHALDGAATVIGMRVLSGTINWPTNVKRLTLLPIRFIILCGFLRPGFSDYQHNEGVGQVASFIRRTAIVRP
jgi:hypothetical protein